MKGKGEMIAGTAEPSVHFLSRRRMPLYIVPTINTLFIYFFKKVVL